MPTGAIFISQPVSAAPDHLHPGEKEPCRNSRSLRPDWADEAAFFHVLISLAYRHRHLPLTHEAADHRVAAVQIFLHGFQDLVKIFFAAAKTSGTKQKHLPFVMKFDFVDK